MRELLTLAVIGLGTYAMRAAFLVMAHRAPPARVARLLPYVGPAVLAAITRARVRGPARHDRVRGDGTGAARRGRGVAGVAPPERNLPIALFGGLAVWWIASWAVSAAGGLGLGPS